MNFRKKSKGGVGSHFQSKKYQKWYTIDALGAILLILTLLTIFEIFHNLDTFDNFETFDNFDSARGSEKILRSKNILGSQKN